MVVVHGEWFTLVTLFCCAVTVVFVNHITTNGELVLSLHPQSLDQGDFHVLHVLNSQSHHHRVESFLIYFASVLWTKTLQKGFEFLSTRTC